MAELAPRVLVVEDDRGVSQLVERRLETAGYAVTTAYATRDALARLREGAIDLIVLDQRLPGDLSGLEFCAQLQAMGSEVPIVMVSGSSSEGTVIGAIRSGVRDFLPKSSTYLDQLPAAVSKALERSRPEMQLARASDREWSEGVVLVVEDDAGTAELQRRHLERSGYKVVIAASADVAIERLRDTDVALLVLDQHLPDGRSGLELYRQLQAAGHDLPAILVTGFADETMAIEALRAGVRDLVVKSDDFIESLAAAIRRVFERSYPETRLSEARARLTGIINSSMDAILAVEQTDWHVSLFNAAAEQMFDYSAAEAIGMPADCFIPGLFGDPAQLGNGVATPQLRRFETTGVRRDGSGIAVEVSLTQTGAMHKRFYTVMVRDIGERRRMEDELRQRAEHLGRVDQQKDAFIAMLAHELRNPMAPIPTAVALLRHITASTDTRVTWAYDIIDRQVAHMARLVDDLLDVSRLIHGRVTLRRVPLDLAVVIERASDACRPAMDKQGCRFETVLPSAPLPVFGDEARLTQVISNLLDNAAKYSRLGGRVQLRAAVEPDEVVVVVRDEGRGIDPEFLPHVFEAFSQSDHSLARTEGGLGIGLAFVQHLVDLHGGHVSASSEGLGHGAEFTVRLPLAASREAPRVPANRPRTDTPSRRVLVVDDNRDTAQSTAMLLKNAGHSVEVVYEGASAIEAARRFRPQVLLLDLGLPGMDGYTLARRLRGIPETGHSQFIAMSGYARPEDRRRSRAAGYDHHLAKPIDPDKLVELIGGLPVG